MIVLNSVRVWYMVIVRVWFWLLSGCGLLWCMGVRVFWGERFGRVLVFGCIVSLSCWCGVGCVESLVGVR